jgi:hypothetical protein
VLAIAVASILLLQGVESCTSCGSASFVRDGPAVELPEVAGLSAMVVMIACALWTLLLAGFLASDHLAEPLQDGSAGETGPFSARSRLQPDRDVSVRRHPSAIPNEGVTTPNGFERATSAAFVATSGFEV